MPLDTDILYELDLGEPPKHILNWAKENIRENPDTKCLILEDFRDMIYSRGKCTPHRTDDAFLLRFLRGRNFNIESAHRLLVNYYNFKENNPEFFDGVNLYECLRFGYEDIITVPPYREQTGRRFLLYRFGNWDPEKYTITELFRATMTALELAILEPRAQILGGIAIFDMSDLTLNQVTQLTPTIAHKVIQIMVTSFPMKIHAVHVVFQPWIFETIYKMFQPFLTGTMKNRIFFHGDDMESLHRHIDPIHLPKKVKMEDVGNRTKEKICITIKNIQEEENEDNINYDLIPNFVVAEPKEDDVIMKWAELNIDENPNNKLELIEELRDMIFEKGECEPHRTDDAFLLRFLRARHFIVRMAHRLIVNYYTFKETNPELFYNLDYDKLLEIGESEVFSLPPYVDQDGRRMLIVRFENWDPSQFTTNELLQSIIFIIQTATLEPRHQILGGICIIDVHNLGTGHAWYLTPTIAKQMLAVAYSSLPHRVQAVHIVNASRIFDYAFSMLKPFLSDIMKERIFIHPDMESLHKHVSPKYLPKRFGGIHKDYGYNSWLTVLKNNEDFHEEMTSIGYEGCREFIQKV